MAIAVCALLAGNAFAGVVTDITAGIAYGHSSINTIKDNTLKTDGCADESLGFNIGICSELFTHFGLFLDVDCLWPMKTTQTADGNSISVDTEGAFAMNGILGATFIFPINDGVKFKLGGGFDIGGVGHQIKDINDVITETITIDYGVGLKTDLSFVLGGFIGLNLGCDFGFLWGGETISREKDSLFTFNVKNENKYGEDTFMLFVIPSVNVVIQLGKH